MNHFWRLSEAGPNNLGLACTDDGLLLGHTSLIERQGDRFVVRERGEVDRLLKRAYHGEPPVDRLMGGLATVASALNANDQCLARIAAVHLKIPDLPSAAARDAMAAEDSLIKYARDEGSGGASWDPALHPRTDTPPNPGWFAPTGGSHGESSAGESSDHESRLRFAENWNDSHRTEAAPTSNERLKLPRGDRIGEQGDFSDVTGLRDQHTGGDFWSNVRSSVSHWLQEPVPEYDLESGRVVGERPRWQAIAPYVGATVATALAPAAASAFGLGGATEIGANAAAGSVSLAQRAAQIQGVLDPIAQQMRTTAVLETNIGRIVAGGARDLAPSQRAFLGQGEIAVQAPGVHAEMTALDAAASLGARPLELAVTRPICPECAAAIQASGGTLTGPTTAVWFGP
jgi:hypothetical protein